MLTRLYINNFRCLVAFELRLDTMGVLCGANGTGKSSVFDAIKFIRDLATGNCYLGGVGDGGARTISKLEFTHWLDSKIQEFEVGIETDGHDFDYLIHLEQVADYEQPRIIKEIVSCDGKQLYTRDKNGVKFPESNGFPLDWRQAALASIQPVQGRREIELLQKAFSNLLILRPNAREFENESKLEIHYPNLDFSNLTSWYRHLAQDQEWTDLLRESLQSVWPEDLKSLKMADAGITTKWLELRFEGENLRFDQLSDGEKMLVGLYMIHAALSMGNIKTVLIDEPDNFVSLQELQPWLLSISEIIDKEHQALIISHNVEILESNPSRGYYFWRDNHQSPTRIGQLKIPEGISTRDAIVRGWVRTVEN